MAMSDHNSNETKRKKNCLQLQPNYGVRLNFEENLLNHRFFEKRPGYIGIGLNLGFLSYGKPAQAWYPEFIHRSGS